ncbi:uncharacterized protein LOC144945449 [Lampetra fluviatilis]
MSSSLWEASLACATEFLHPSSLPPPRRGNAATLCGGGSQGYEWRSRRGLFTERMPPWLGLVAAWALCTLGVETVQDRLMPQIEAKHYYNCEGAGPYVVHRSDCSQVPQTWAIYKDQQEVIASTTNSTCVKPCVAVFSNCTLILSRCPAVLLQLGSAHVPEGALPKPLA